MSDSPPPPRSKTMGAGVGLIGAVGVVTLLLVLFKGGGSGTGGTGPGAGSGTGSGVAATTQALLPAQPTRPLKVTIQESDYVVSGRPLDLVTVTDLAGKVPAGGGPAVLVERSPSSRAKAEAELREALDKKGISHASD